MTKSPDIPYYAPFQKLLYDMVGLHSSFNRVKGPALTTDRWHKSNIIGGCFGLVGASSLPLPVKYQMAESKVRVESSL